MKFPPLAGLAFALHLALGTCARAQDGMQNTIDPTSGVVTVANGSLLDGPASHNVTVQADDGAGGMSLASNFTVSVNNVAPTVAADNGLVTVSEGAAAHNSGTFGDVGADAVTLAASVGAVLDNGNGTWSWSFNASDGPDQTQLVTITATDSDGVATTTSFNLVVNNVAPVIETVDAPVIDEDSTAFITGSFSDEGELDTHNLMID